MDNNKKELNINCAENNGTINATKNGDIYPIIINNNNIKISIEINDIKELIDKNFSVRIKLHKDYLESIYMLSKSGDIWWEAEAEFVFDEWYEKINVLNHDIQIALEKLKELSFKLFTKCSEFKQMDYKYFKTLEVSKNTQHEKIIELNGKRIHIMEDFLETVYPKYIKRLEEQYNEVLVLFDEKKISSFYNL